MSADVVEDLVSLYRASVPPDVSASPVGEDVAYSIAEGIARAEEEVSRLSAGSKLGTAVGSFMDLHLRDHGLRRQDGETDDQGRNRVRTPPQAITPAAILEAVNAIVGVRATLDLAPLTVNVETVLRAVTAGAIGNQLTLQMSGFGSSVIGMSVGGRDHHVRFVPGVSLVAQLESLIDDSGLIEVATADGVGTMAAGDAIGKTSFSGGLDKAALIEVPLDGSFYDREYFFDRDDFMGGGRGVVIILIPASASARTSVLDAVRTKIAAGKIWFVLEYT